MKKRTLECTLLILALLLSLFSVSAFAAQPEDEKPALEMGDVIINEFDSTLYNDGDVVINNFGIVYNNGGVVYNNGGIVYNNEGTVYNNGGVVYNNGAEVYNNGGTVHNNDNGTVHESQPVSPEATAAEEEPVPREEEGPRQFILSPEADYSALALLEGAVKRTDGSYILYEDSELRISARPGLVLTDAVTSTGRCSMDEEGLVTLSLADRDGRLSLKFKAESPAASLPSGSYGEEQHISLSGAPEGGKILYTLDGSSPLKKGMEYKKPIELEDSVRLKAVTVMEGAADSDIVEYSYIFPELEEPEFKSVKEGYDSVEPGQIVLINTGTGTLRVESVGLEGRDKASFRLNTAKGGSLAGGQRDARTWTITPLDGLKAGEYKALLVFTLEGGSRLYEDVSFTVRK